MRIGRLRHRVQLQTYREKELYSHSTFKEWETIATLFADVKPVSGLVTLDTQQLEKTITHKIIIRYYPNVTTENWLLMENRRFRIRSVTNTDERNIQLVLLCEEVFRATDHFKVGINSVGDPLIDDLPREDSDA